jgi:hypothetical protein
MKPVSFLLNIGSNGKVASSEFKRLPRYGIYIMLDGPEVIRIGECSAGESRLKKGFRDPFRRNLRGKERKNYIAYSWRDNYCGRCVNLDYFELNDDRFSDNYLRRALEAELTFQFRVARKRWPLEMSEIHFLERFRNDALLVATATAILEHYGISYNGRV